MNDRKVKGKPHIEAKQWAKIIKVPVCTFSEKVFTFSPWSETTQGSLFWSKTVNKIKARGR